MAPSMRTKIRPPNCEGRQSAFTFLGPIFRPQDGPFFGAALLSASREHVRELATTIPVASFTSPSHGTRFVHVLPLCPKLP